MKKSEAFTFNICAKRKIHFIKKIVLFLSLELCGMLFFQNIFSKFDQMEILQEKNMKPQLCKIDSDI